MTAKKKVAAKATKKETPSVSGGPNLSRIKGFAKSFGPGRGDRAEWVKIKPTGPTETTLRILPACHGNDLWVEEHWTHRNSFNSNGTWSAILDDGTVINRMVTCLEHHSESPCPVCQVIEWIDENDEDVDVGRLKSGPRYLLNVWSFDQEKPLMWGASPGVWKQLQNRIELWEKQGKHKLMDLAHPKTGENFMLSVSDPGNGFWKYDVQWLDRDSLEEYPEEKELQDLKQFIRVPTYEEALQLVSDNLASVLPLEKIFGKGKVPTPRATKKTAPTKGRRK